MEMKLGQRQRYFYELVRVRAHTHKRAFIHSLVLCVVYFIWHFLCRIYFSVPLSSIFK